MTRYSNLDWGQGLLALRDYERSHPGETISAVTVSKIEMPVYGIHARLLGEKDRPTGTVVIGATSLTGQLNYDRGAFRWLLPYGPPQMLDHSMLVFRVPSRPAVSEDPAAPPDAPLQRSQETADPSPPPAK